MSILIFSWKTSFRKKNIYDLQNQKFHRNFMVFSWYCYESLDPEKKNYSITTLYSL